MFDTQPLEAEVLKGLSPAELTGRVTQMLTHIAAQSKRITGQTKHIDALAKRIDSQPQGSKWRDAKIESITFQLARFVTSRRNPATRSRHIPASWRGAEERLEALF